MNVKAVVYKPNVGMVHRHAISWIDGFIHAFTLSTQRGNLSWRSVAKSHKTTFFVPWYNDTLAC